MDADRQFASRSGEKLAHALAAWSIDPQDWICADLGSHAGGFVDCLLRAGAARVYAVERGYGVMDSRLRGDARVVVLERVDARTVHLPESVRLVTIDTGWTRQAQILPSAARLLAAGGDVITLVKPHYEARPTQLSGGVLPDMCIDSVLDAVRGDIRAGGWRIAGEVESPIRGHGGNREFLWRLMRIE